MRAFTATWPVSHYQSHCHGIWKDQQGLDAVLQYTGRELHQHHHGQSDAMAGVSLRLLYKEARKQNPQPHLYQEENQCRNSLKLK